jgi:large subunit ribosomal protein L25
MERVELKAQSRSLTGKKVEQLRRQNLIPAVVYGPDTPAKSIQIEERALTKALHEAGSTALIDLHIDDKGKPNVVLARDIQRDILTSRFQHVDFYQVRLGEKVRTSPPLEIVGQSPLVKSGAAVLVQILNHIEVECLPTDLISSIPVDISVLKKLDDSITVADLSVPPGITILADPGDTVASVVPPRATLEEEAEAEEALAVEEAEVEGAVISEAEIEEEAEAEG